jgi:hypothetical protein
MNNIGRYNPPIEPDRELVEFAIVAMLEIAQRQGIIAAAECLQNRPHNRFVIFLNAILCFLLSWERRIHAELCSGFWGKCTKLISSRNL